jgi:hypothetical protein
MTLPSYAQYVGRVDTSKDAKTPTLRATAVLEYTGDVTRPVSSRLIPLAVWDGLSYQPGGLYMAQPIPMTVESGTQYELQVAGVPKGLYDVRAAADVSGSWIAIGNYQSPVAPKPSKLRASRNPPHVIRDADFDDDKPHFAHRPADSTPDAGSAKASNNAPPVDPDRPTLHKRTGSSDPSASTSGSTPAGTSGDTANSNAPAVDPDRPTLHHHESANANDNGAPVSATMDVDPDRPRLRRGRPAEMEALDVAPTTAIAKLDGQQPELKEMVAVSDARTRETHNFLYSWTDPEDQKKMQAALEDMARNLLAGKPLQPAIASAPAPGTKSKGSTAARPAATTKSAAGATASSKTGATAATRTGATTARRKAGKPQPPALPSLADEQFHAYALTFGGGATLVFTARSTMPDGKVKYATIIAQPDFNGVPQVIFKQVTSEDELDVLPRMILVDAADTDADNRAELIFEMAGKTDRQYAIYRVADRSVEQVFSTAGAS